VIQAMHNARMARALDALDRLIGALLGAGAWLALPVVFLLFMQWPLRELVQRYSREANDLGQIFFALYVAMAVTRATRARAHLAVDVLASRYSHATRVALERVAAVAGAIPWAIFVLVAGAPMIASSIAQLEAFPDTFNPGYFIVKIAMGLASLLVLAQAVVDLARGNSAEMSAIDRTRARRPPR